MSTTVFNRDKMARWYAKEHFKVDPGVLSIHYLPGNAPEREIRLLEVNELIAERTLDVLEPLDYGVDRYSDTEHTLYVLDVTPSQWKRIERGSPLPAGWTLAGEQVFSRPGS